MLVSGIVVTLRIQRSAVEAVEHSCLVSIEQVLYETSQTGKLKLESPSKSKFAIVSKSDQDKVFRLLKEQSALLDCSSKARSKNDISVDVWGRKIEIFARQSSNGDTLFKVSSKGVDGISGTLDDIHDYAK